MSGRCLRSFTILAFAALLAGCSESWRLDDQAAIELNQPDKRHPITFSERREVLFLELPHMGAGLSSGQQTDVQGFLQRYKREGVNGIRLSTPRSPRAHMAAQRSVADIEGMMVRAGLDPAQLLRSRHRADPQYGETLQIAFRRPVAIAPECGDWSKDLGVDRERLTYNNFGCATQRNFAKMVASSRDIVSPQPESPRASERRSVQWSEYVAGGGSSGGGGGGSDQGSGAKPAIK